MRFAKAGDDGAPVGRVPLYVVRLVSTDESGKEKPRRRKNSTTRSLVIDSKKFSISVEKTKRRPQWGVTLATIECPDLKPVHSLGSGMVSRIFWTIFF